MLSSLRKLSSRLAPAQFSASDSIFPNIDTAGLIRQIAPDEEGAKRGKDELPLTASSGLDAFEAKVVEKLNEYRRQGLNSYDQHMQVYSQRLARAVDALAKIETESETARTDFIASAKTWGNHLANERSILEERSHEYAAFRQKHGLLDRSARRPWPLILTIGIVAIMILLETVLNGYFFAQSNVLGLLGGSSVALVISIVNVTFSLLLGFFGRWIVHRKFLPTLIGLSVILFWVALAVGFNMAVGHFRDVVDGREWNDAAVTALENLTIAPLRLESIESWLLVGFGALISFVCFLKGFYLDDPYPGFGRVARGLQDARRDYADEVEQAHDELLEKRDQAKENLEYAGNSARDDINDAVDVAYARKGLIAQRQVYIDHCEDVANQILTIYREANVRNRSTDAPSHFTQAHTYPELEDGFAKQEGPERARDAITRIEGAVEKAVQDIFAAFDASIDAHRSIEEIETSIKLNNQTKRNSKAEES